MVSANFTEPWCGHLVELMEGWRKTLRNPGGGANVGRLSGYHLVYLSLYFLGVPRDVFGSQVTVTWQIQSEDTATAVLCYESGVASPRCSRVGRPTTRFSEDPGSGRCGVPKEPSPSVRGYCHLMVKILASTGNETHLPKW